MKKISTLVGIIIIVVIAVILFGGVFAYQYFSTKTQPVAQSTKNSSTTNQVSSVIVAGMSKYTDQDFGFSFWYPNSWTIQPPPSRQYIGLSGGAVVKTIVVGPVNDPSNSIAIQEFVSSDMSITDNSSCGPAEGCSESLTYFFDAATHTWMSQRHAPNATPLTVFINTMGGLHLLGGNARFGDDYIIPLSAKNFLVVSSVEAGTIQEGLFAQTITATDPSVATPANTDQQIKTIHTEGLLYGALGTSVPSWGYTDSQYVYDSQGNIVVGANPATFKAINTYSDGFSSPTGFATDGVRIYSEAMSAKAVLVEGADPATFIAIRQSYQIPYAKDSGVYGQSFTAYDTNYEKDKYHVWDKGRLIPGADPKTFIVIGDADMYTDTYNNSGGFTFAKDANHLYGEDTKGNITVDGVTVKQ